MSNSPTNMLALARWFLSSRPTPVEVIPDGGPLKGGFALRLPGGAFPSGDVEIVASVREEPGPGILTVPELGARRERIELLRSRHRASDQLEGLVHLPGGIDTLHLDLTGRGSLGVVTVRALSTLASAWKRSIPLGKSAWLERRRLPAILRRLWNLTWTEGPRATLDALQRVQFGSRSYQEWTRTYDEFGPLQLATVEARISQMEIRPIISIVLLDTGAPIEMVQVTLDSIASQLYGNWQLCAASGMPALQALESMRSTLGARLATQHLPSPVHAVDSGISGFSLVAGTFVIFLEPGDRLPRHALFEVAQLLIRNAELDVVYTDEDVEDLRGSRTEPVFKPEWSPELLRTDAYLGKLVAYRVELVERVGGLGPATKDGFLHGLALRCTAAAAQNHIGHLPLVLCHRPPSSGAREVSREINGPSPSAMREFLSARGISGSVETGLVAGTLRVRYEAAQRPLVSVIVPTRDRLRLLRRCIESVRRLTLEARFELLIVDNDSAEPPTRAYLDDLRGTNSARVLAMPGPFNFSAIINRAAEHAHGSILCLLNNDVEVISREWLTEMVSLAIQPGVGAVGAKLYYPNNTIQHAGIVIGLFGSAGHLYRYAPRSANGYRNGLKVVREVAAVTGACLVVRKDLFLEVGGFDENNLPITFSDFDFCLKLLAAGHRNLWTPYAELYHHESASRGRDNGTDSKAGGEQESRCFRSRWHSALPEDPYYSPNLSLDRDWPEPAWPPRTRPSLALEERPARSPVSQT